MGKDYNTGRFQGFATASEEGVERLPDEDKRLGFFDHLADFLRGNALLAKRSKQSERVFGGHGKQQSA